MRASDWQAAGCCLAGHVSIDVGGAGKGSDKSEAAEDRHDQLGPAAY